MLDAALFGLAGIVLLIIGYYLWELITPYNLRREIHENRNIAVAIVVAAFILGMAIIIAAVPDPHQVIARPCRGRSFAGMRVRLHPNLRDRDG